ncbi:hypothetical protein L0128_11700 [candidate division KSB1 bacterium]|nr:hypothetical protein [candidate division KSB1 bacterium]
MVKLSQKYKREDLVILPISTIGNKRITANWSRVYLLGKESVFPILLKGREVQRQFNGRGLPNTFIIDKSGQIRFQHRNFSDGLGRLFEMEINELLQAKSKPG